MLADFTSQKKNKILHRKRITKFCGPAGHLRGPRPRKEEEEKEKEKEKEEAGRQRKSRNPNLTGGVHRTRRTKFYIAKEEQISQVLRDHSGGRCRVRRRRRRSMLRKI